MFSKKELMLAYGVTVFLLVIGAISYAAFPLKAPEEPLRLMYTVAAGNVLFNHKIHISKVIPTFFNARRKASKEVLQSISRAFPNKIGPPIRMCTSIAESSGLEQTVFEFKNSSNGAVDYLKLCKEVLQNG